MLCLAFIAGFWGWRDLRSALDDWRFAWQLPAYVHVIEAVRATPSGSPDSDKRYVRPRADLPGGVGFIAIEGCGQGRLVVRFMIRHLGGALGPHGGYLYDECSEAAPGAAPADYTRPHESYRHLKGAWYEFYRP